MMVSVKAGRTYITIDTMCIYNGLAFMRDDVKQEAIREPKLEAVKYTIMIRVLFSCFVSLRTMMNIVQ
jgi:hypothetical protein